MWLVKGAPNLMQRLSRLPAAPNVTLLNRRKPKSLSWPHANATFTQPTYIRWCCIDLSNAPRLPGVGRLVPDLPTKLREVRRNALYLQSLHELVWSLGRATDCVAATSLHRKFSTSIRSVATLSSWLYRTVRPSGATASPWPQQDGFFSITETLLIRFVAASKYLSVACGLVRVSMKYTPPGARAQ